MPTHTNAEEQYKDVSAGHGRALVQVRLHDTLTVWQSPLLSEHDVLHAFTTRHGGTSVGPRATLDLAGRGSREGEDLVAAEENRKRLWCALKLDETVRPILLHQVHGAEVHHDDGSPPCWPPPRADCIISNKIDALLMVRVADCAPILIHDPVTGASAAVHSGWRGTVADVPGAAVRALAETFGSQPNTLIAAIGPLIGVERFEVGPEVAEAFHQAGLGASVRQRDPRPHVDLFEAVRHQLHAAGLPLKAIDGMPICSYEREADCFSYRRDGPESGRMAAVIAPRAQVPQGADLPMV